MAPETLQLVVTSRTHLGYEMSQVWLTVRLDV